MGWPNVTSMFRRPSIAAPGQTLGVMGRALAPSLPREFHVVVWNVAKGKNPQLGADLQQLVWSSNLALVQEAVVPKTLVGQRNWHSAQSFKTPDDFFTGVATGSSAEALAARAIASHAREPVLNTPKMTLATTYAIEGRPDPLLVVNTHAINFVGNSAFASQLEQIRHLILEHRRGPVLLAGDFNTWSPARERALQELATALELRHVKPASDPRHLVLDHAFVGGDLTVEFVRVITTVGSSDHWPVLMGLKAN